MLDFEGKEIKINDEVIYIKPIRTGSSSVRKIMFKGRVKEIKNKKAKIERLFTNEFEFEKNKIDEIFSKDIYVIR